MPVKDTPDNVKKCICQKCPSYPEGCTSEILYCARSASQCEIPVAGCICGACAVYIENMLAGLYFCDKVKVGSGKAMMRKRRAGEAEDVYQDVVEIKELAKTGKSIICSMGSQEQLPFSFSDIHFIPAQVYKMPREREDKVNTEITIGPRAKKPLVVTSPILISGMSLGATSRNLRLVISRVAKELGIAYNSGEGGILEEEMAEAPKHLIGQYATDREAVEMSILKRLAAVEIRFGQGAYPGKGSYVPEGKIVNEEVAKVKGLKGYEQSSSPAHHFDMNNPKELKDKMAWLRENSDMVPIGAKIGCGNVERDMEILVDSGVDFIALDGFGGGTGATEQYVRDNVGIPIIAALPRASRYLKEVGAEERVTLIAGGGLRTSADFAKCLALGADAVYIATAALVAINCEQYRICHTGLCPTGVTSHKPSLTRNLSIELGIRRLSNFIRISTEEIANITRIVGKDDVRKLCIEDLVSMKKELSEMTGTRWLSSA
ncbi:MAG: glutamate synthase-related protein [Candidatus Methanomethylicaceae archaeon]